MAAEYEIFMASADGTLIAQVDDYNSLELTFQFNDVSNWILDLPADQVWAFAWQRRIIVNRNGVLFFSGPLSNYNRTWSRTTDSVSISGHDDTQYIKDRIVWPEVNGNFSASAYDVRSGVAETVLKQYANFNAGPGAILPRRTGISIETDLGRGASVIGSGRFDELLPFLQGLAVSGVGLGFRVVGLEFQVYEPEDKSATVIFSKELGTARAVQYWLASPSANHVLVLGSGDDTARVIYETMDSDSIVRHGRIETTRDRRDTSDPAQLSQTGLEELAQDQETVSLDMTPVDIDNMRGFEDWWLGDTVTAIVDNAVITDVVREVKVTVTRDAGETMQPVIGTQNAVGRNNPLSRLLDAAGRVNQRLTNLEKV